MPIKPQAVFEIHISVEDRHRSAKFYETVLGFKLATHIDTRDITFLWMGEYGQGMIGLWGKKCPNPPISRGRCHIAFQLPKDELINSIVSLQELGVTPLDFDKMPTDEPVVLAWMPALSVYFTDPNGHSLEFLCMLDDTPRPELGVLKYSEWQKRQG